MSDWIIAAANATTAVEGTSAFKSPRTEGYNTRPRLASVVSAVSSKSSNGGRTGWRSTNQPTTTHNDTVEDTLLGGNTQQQPPQQPISPTSNESDGKKSFKAIINKRKGVLVLARYKSLQQERDKAAQVVPKEPNTTNTTATPNTLLPETKRGKGGFMVPPLNNLEVDPLTITVDAPTARNHDACKKSQQPTRPTSPTSSASVFPPPPTRQPSSVSGVSASIPSGTSPVSGGTMLKGRNYDTANVDDELYSRSSTPLGSDDDGRSGGKKKAQHHVQCVTQLAQELSRDRNDIINIVQDDFNVLLDGFTSLMNPDSGHASLSDLQHIGELVVGKQFQVNSIRSYNSRPNTSVTFPTLLRAAYPSLSAEDMLHQTQQLRMTPDESGLVKSALERVAMIDRLSKKFVPDVLYEIVDIFDMFDQARKGYLTKEEFKAVIGGHTTTDEDYTEQFNEQDLKGDGIIDLEEFVEMMKYSYPPYCEDSSKINYETLDYPE